MMTRRHTTLPQPTDAGMETGEIQASDQIFVYGTLKRGGANHRLIEGKFTRSRPAAAQGLLFNLGAFPAAWFRDNRFLYGEVFEFEDVNTVLPSLDWLEGCPTLYQRIHIPLFDPETLEPDGTTAWAYEYHRMPDDDRLIPGGVWENAR